MTMWMYCVFVNIMLVWYTEGFLDDLERPDINAIRSRLEEEKEKRLLMENDVTMLMLKFGRLERSINDESFSPSVKTVDSISFHASYSKSDLKVVQGQVVVFDNVITNNGAGYSPNSGTFRALKRGVYMFTANILTPGSSNIHAGIYKNGDQLARLFAGTQDSWSNLATQSLVVNLEVGDEIFVRATADGVIHSSNYCTFNGFLVN